MNRKQDHRPARPGNDGLCPFLCVRIDGITIWSMPERTSKVRFYFSILSSCPQDYREAESLTGRNFADLVRIARVNGWPGYFGAPRLASAAMGAQAFALSSQKLNEMALQILDGLDYRNIPRYADEMDPLIVAGEGAELGRKAFTLTTFPAAFGVRCS